MHSFDTGVALARKKDNWDLLSKFFSKRGIRMFLFFSEKNSCVFHFYSQLKKDRGEVGVTRLSAFHPLFFFLLQLFPPLFPLLFSILMNLVRIHVPSYSGFLD